MKNKTTFEYGYDRWFRLDNSATIYPMLITKTAQSLFRMGAELKSDVDAAALERAANAIMPRFPSFAVQLRHGVFRAFLDANNNRVPVFLDDGALMAKIDLAKNNRFFFKVAYFKNRILVDFFHALCDGAAGAEFTKALVFQYLAECGERVAPDGSVMLAGGQPTADEFEDSFLKYYKKVNLTPELVKKMRGTHAVQIKGKRFRKVGFGLVEGTVDADGLKMLAKRHDCTITVLITALLLLSVAEMQCHAAERLPLVAMVPVNLRKMFPSSSVMNFTTVTYNSVDPNSTPRTTEAYVAKIKAELAKELDKTLVSERLSFTSYLDKSPFAKLTPFFLKKFFTKLGRTLTQKTTMTMMVSNLGVLSMPPDVKNFVNSFVFNLNCSKRVPNNAAIATYNGKTVISFTRMITHTDFEKTFFRKLTAAGLAVDVKSNLRESDF